MTELTTFKSESIEVVALAVSEELGCSLVEAVSKLQAQCVRSGNEAILEDLCAYKWKLIEAA